MKKKLIALAVVFVGMGTVLSTVTPATATPARKNAPGQVKKNAVPKCPRCGMPLATKKDATHNSAIKVNGKTYFCCGGCADETAATSKQNKAKQEKPKTKPNKKVAAIPMCPQCNMQMIATKSLLKGTPIKVNGKTYYCCTICPNH